VIGEEDVLMLAKMAGLEIDPAYLPGVTANLRTLLDQTALLVTPPLAPEIEPAAVYRA
jgi:hypothetical protein